MSAAVVALALLCAACEVSPVRTPTAAETQVLAATGGRRALVRVKVKDSGGTFRDLSTYPGTNLVLGATFREDVDSAGLTGEVSLQREEEALSLAPLMEDSPLNRGFNPAASYAPLLALRREVQIERAIVADEVEPGAGDWVLAFHGYLDRVDSGGEAVALEARDLSAKLLDTFIEEERVYAHAQGANALKGLRIFELGTAYVLNELVMPSETRRNAHFYKVTTAGTVSSTVEPAWPTGGGATVGSGTAVFTEVGATSTSAGTPVEDVIQQIIDDNLGAGVVTLEVPVSPSWDIKWFLQRRDATLTGIRALVDQIGWDLRFLWDSGSSSYKLTLIEPDRAKTTPDHTFAASEVLEVQGLAQRLDMIRNAVRVVYSDSTDLDPQGRPKRKRLTVTDATSITAYGRRFMEVAEGESSNIDSSAEATTMAEAMRDDLSTPVAELSVTVPFFPWVELGDLYRFTANEIHFTSDQDLAVSGYEHTFDGETARTRFDLRGKPSAGARRHLAKELLAQPGDRHDFGLANSGGLSAIFEPVAGGARVAVAVAEGKNSHQSNVELHVSEVAGFTPDSSSLVAAGRVRQMNLNDLLPGKEYYASLISYSFNGERIVRSLPSTEQSFVAGYTTAKYLSPGQDYGLFPYNGSFEDLDSSDANRPWHWEMVTGTWDDEIYMRNADSASAHSGANNLAFTNQTTTVAKIKSYPFPVSGSDSYLVSVWRQNLSDTGTWHVKVEWLDYAQTTISTSTVLTIDVTDAVSTWKQSIARVSAPSTATYARVRLERNAAAGGAGFIIGEVRVARYPVEQEPWTAPSLGASWVNFGSTYSTAGYRLDANGAVHLRGLIKDGTTTPATVLFTLPAGYRPEHDLVLVSVASGSAVAELRVRTNGDVEFHAGSATWTSLDGLTFRAYQ